VDAELQDLTPFPQATRPGPVVRGTFSPARAWRPAVVDRLVRTLVVTNAALLLFHVYVDTLTQSKPGVRSCFYCLNTRGAGVDAELQDLTPFPPELQDLTPFPDPISPISSSQGSSTPNPWRYRNSSADLAWF